MKRTFVVISLMLFAILMLSACGGSKDEPEAAPAAAEEAEAEPAEETTHSGDAENGQSLYMASCTACHGPEGKGIEGLGKDMTTSEFIAGLSDS